MEVACGGSDAKRARWCLNFRGGASRRLPVTVADLEAPAFHGAGIGQD